MEDMYELWTGKGEVLVNLEYIGCMQVGRCFYKTCGGDDDKVTMLCKRGPCCVIEDMRE